MPDDLNCVEQITQLVDFMAPYIGEILDFNIKDWLALKEVELKHQKGVLKYLTKVREAEWQEMDDVHQLPCYNQEGMEMMQVMFPVPVHPEHKRLRRAHARFKKRWRKLQERLNGTEKDQEGNEPGA